MPGRSTPPTPDRLAAAMGQERVDQRAVDAWPARRVDDQPGGLDQHDQVLVLEQDLQRVRLGAGRAGARRRHVEHEALARFDPVAGLGYHPLALAQTAFAHETPAAASATDAAAAARNRSSRWPVMLGRGASSTGPTQRPPLAEMSDSLLKALKLFVVVGGILIVGGTATLIWVLVKRGTSGDAWHRRAVASALPGTIELPPGARWRR